MQDHQMSAPPRGASPMVSSANVHGTYVYSAEGKYLGRINYLMIDKVSGNIAYAVMVWGGFLGLVPNEQPVPWKTLRFDVKRGAYVTDLSPKDLEDAPNLPDDWEESCDYARSSYDYYGVPYFW